MLLAVVAVAVLACARDYPQTTLLPRSDFAHLLDATFRKTVYLAVIVFVLVEGALLFAIWKFRARPGAPEPAQTHGNTTLEIVWTMIPAVILALIAVPTVRTIFRTATKPGPEALQVEVVGHQWWWEFRYPDLGIVTANELHVPTGRTVNLEMTTADVIHSFWLPQFAGKRDVFPNRHNNLWFKAEVEGNYPGQCAEFCGLQHGRMAYRIVAQPPEAFDAWAANFNTPGARLLRHDEDAGPDAPARPAAVYREGLRWLPFAESSRDAWPHRSQPPACREPELYRGGHAQEHRRESGQVAA
jgi:cytochrome c oxidase subunit 2